MTAKPWAGRPCAGEGCDRILRSQRYPKDQAPGTHTAVGHGMFMRARRARGIQTEGVLT